MFGGNLEIINKISKYVGAWWVQKCQHLGAPESWDMKNKMIKDSEAWETGISYNLALVLSNCVIDLVGLAAQERTLEGLNGKGFVKIGSQTEEPCALEVKAEAIEA